MEQQPETYRFEQAVPVKLTAAIVTRKTNGGTLAMKIIGTPFALAADAVGTVVALPFVALIGIGIATQ
ncbi:hypothetical protein [Kingella negevensis]|uniref:Uncharacterized protein n=1 Tax=Kingella negevensis TaxID=1522312 RepID=A0A238TCD9_9NEIS|nr:hypothetical protein [Kingella negevensis]MDK4681271.1 hypothetical protein [Kingella negevensis]MDK4683468.1 hypothetical protein [Kingella negevensis]MDK4684086.1 hypothetical protein [Kingella negevensis]MDK4689135.1 hypothetical protein [Kingella negevensis]MDK4691397.1 hypothetical protein [Kingella negevensis]